MNNLRILSGTANLNLATSIAEYLDIRITDTLITRFSDGEIRVQVQESVRGMDVFLIQPTCPPTSENILELLIILDALKRASPKRITAVIPYYGYARQEKKNQATRAYRCTINGGFDLRSWRQSNLSYRSPRANNSRIFQPTCRPLTRRSITWSVFS